MCRRTDTPIVLFKTPKRESNAHLFAHTESGEKSIAPDGVLWEGGYLSALFPNSRMGLKIFCQSVSFQVVGTILLGKFGLKSFTKNAGFLKKKKRGEGGWFFFWFLVEVGWAWAAQSYLGFHDHLTMRQSTCIGRSWSLTFIPVLHSLEL